MERESKVEIPTTLTDLEIENEEGESDDGDGDVENPYIIIYY